MFANCILPTSLFCGVCRRGECKNIQTRPCRPCMKGAALEDSKLKRSFNGDGSKANFLFNGTACGWSGLQPQNGFFPDTGRERLS